MKVLFKTYFHIKRMKSLAFSSIVLLAGIGLLSGCRTSKSSKGISPEISSTAIKHLEKRVTKLEELLLETSAKSKNSVKQKINDPIKSLTFRRGTKDDRLRIYWSDGTNSDLPCTKEQSIWVCG